MNDRVLLNIQSLDNLEVIFDFSDNENGIYQIEYDNSNFSEDIVREAVVEYIEKFLANYIEEDEILD